MFGRSTINTISDNTTKLITSVYTNDLTTIKQLITETNINKVINTKNNYTILHYAALVHETNILKYLIELGGNIILKDINGKDVYDIATEENKKCIYEHYRNLYRSNEIKTKSNEETIRILNDTIDKLNSKLSIEREHTSSSTTEISGLKRKLSDINYLYNEEKDKREKLELENKRLKQYSNYKEKYDSSINENNDLLTENKRLKNEKSILENNNKKLINDLEEAENTITRLIKKK